MTAMAQQGSRPAAHRAGFANVLLSEWTKVKSVRGTYIEILLGLGLGLGLTVLFCLAIGSAWDQMAAQDRAEFRAAEIGTVGTFVAQIVLIVFAVMLVSSEYTSGMVRLTMTATPGRTPVLIAKAVVITAACLIIGLIVSLGAFLVAQLVLGFYEPIETASISDEESVRAIVGGWLTMPVIPLLGAALAFVLRSTANTITATLGLVFVPSIFGGILPASLQENILRYFPNFAIDSLSTSGPVSGESLTRLEELPAVAVLLAWLAVFYFAAYISLVRRDV